KREVPPLRSYLPEALVGLIPDAFKMDEQLALEGPRILIRREAAEPGMMQRIHDLAENVELKLLVRGIPDAHRRRTFVPRGPWGLPPRNPPLAGNAVEDLGLIGRPCSGPDEPVAPGLGLAEVAGIHQGQKGQRGIAQPTVAVVPVSDAAYALGQ